jgi:hypothetical protein
MSGIAVTSIRRDFPSVPRIVNAPCAGRRSATAIDSGSLSGGIGAPSPSVGSHCVAHSLAGISPDSSNRIPSTRSAGSL